MLIVGLIFEALLLATLLYVLRKYLVQASAQAGFFLVVFCISFAFLGFIHLLQQGAADELTLTQGPGGHDGFDGDGVFSVTVIKPNEIKARLTDIAGMNEAKKEVSEIIDFLKSAESFSRLGAKPPKGVLMYGPPGTGKTLMARAIAGEANVPFISTSGSAFDDKYVGVGAARVRELFKIARANRPCIVFIDEIDALAGARRSSESGNDQTVNQFLSEIDNVDSESNEGIILLGATNRLESIDEAVLRPGRFDRKVFFRLPNLSERKEILEVLLKKITFDEKLDLALIAQTTTGFSGADLANLVNEAAIDATRKNKKNVDMASFEEANDKIILGVDLGSGSYTDRERKMTAYHEAGHALVGLLHPDHPNVFHKMTIGLRGSSLGVTHFRMETEKYSYTKREFEASIAMGLGGYVAEEVVFGKANVTSGASSDLYSVNGIAREMVTNYAMADERTLVVNDVIDQGSDFVLRNAETILNRNHKAAESIIVSNRAKLDLLAKSLIEKETLDYEDIIKLIGPIPKKSEQ